MPGRRRRLSISGRAIGRACSRKSWLVAERVFGKAGSPVLSSFLFTRHGSKFCVKAAGKLPPLYFLRERFAYACCLRSSELVAR